jgi:prepilin peptidase CpaA
MEAFSEGNDMTGWSGELMAAVIVGLLLCAAWTDVATRVIPNSLAVALALIGVAARSFAGFSAIAVSAGLALLLFVLLTLAHSRGMMGGGDVKLAAATAIGLPAESIYHFIVYTALAGGVLACLHLALRFGLRRSPPHAPRRGACLIQRVLSAERWRIARHGSLPYGVAIACGGIWAVLTARGG